MEYGFYAFIMVLAGYANDASLIYAAEQDIERGLRDDPTFSHGQSALAALALFHGKKESSRRHAEMALEMNPLDVDARHWLAVNWWMSGQNQRAKALEGQNLSQIPRFFPAHETLGEIAQEEGDWAGSISELGQVLEYDPQNNFVLQALARTHMLAGNLPKARETFDRLRPEDRRSFRTRALEALLLGLEGQRDGALKVLDPGSAELPGAERVRYAHRRRGLRGARRDVAGTAMGGTGGSQRRGARGVVHPKPRPGEPAPVAGLAGNRQFSDETAGGMKNPASSL